MDTLTKPPVYDLMPPTWWQQPIILWYTVATLATALLLILIILLWRYKRSRIQKRTLLEEIQYQCALISTLPLRTPQDYAQAYAILAHALKRWLEYRIPHHEDKTIAYSMCTDAECISMLENEALHALFDAPFIELCITILESHQHAQFAGIAPQSSETVIEQARQLAIQITEQHAKASANSTKT